MGQAIKHIWPQAQLTIGPAIDNGFYYDIDLDYTITPDDYDWIEAEMRKIVKADYPIEYCTKNRKEALEWADQHHETYKTELINELPEDSVYKQGEWSDLCAGPHVRSTGCLNSGEKNTKNEGIRKFLLLKSIIIVCGFVQDIWIIIVKICLLSQFQKMKYTVLNR